MSLPGEDSAVLIVPDEMNSKDQGLLPRTGKQRNLLDDENLKIDMDKFDKITSFIFLDQ